MRSSPSTPSPRLPLPRILPLPLLLLLLLLLLPLLLPPVAVVMVQAAPALSDILNGLQDGISVDDITQGILQAYFDNLPSVNEITNQLGVNLAAFDRMPVEVLNLPYVSVCSKKVQKKHSNRGC